MRLTKFSDYSLRVLMYAAASGERLATIDAAAAAYGVSRAHLTKIVTTLVRGGFLEGVRGRSGGFRLARPAAEIRLGDVLRLTEPDFDMVECFATGESCVVSGCCRLPRVMQQGLDAFLAVFDGVTLADVALAPDAFLPPQARAAGRPASGPAGAG
ncbi:MAG: RrF2 family transcriptional regulator [Albimonas sp.]|uniref:RrF2 family transcriptional regulator n=1 Tax=Albimonas sp. TaxID=1872425 RepID=UPI004057B18C